VKQFAILLERIIDRVSVNLRMHDFDVAPYVRGLAQVPKGNQSFACYGLSTHYPIHFAFFSSSLTGSYFLGKCKATHCVLLRSDIRGDELKRSGQELEFEGIRIPLHHDEIIVLRDSFLDTTLVHNCSHDPENPEEFVIRNTVAMPYANIHGAPTEGSFLGAFGTVDLTVVRNCVIGPFAYVNCGEIREEFVEPGTIWLKSADWEFRYTFDEHVLSHYVRHEAGAQVEGLFVDLNRPWDAAFADVFASGGRQNEIPEGAGSFVSRYAVIQGDTSVAENVLVSQRACLIDAQLGRGSNAQEKCCIISSALGSYCVTAHGAKIIQTTVGSNVFTGFNAFVRGAEDAPLTVGDGCIIMPHTIIDLKEPVTIPSNTLVWGHIRTAADLKNNTLDIDELDRSEGVITCDRLRFVGSGKSFVTAFRQRIQHILEENGAFCDGENGRGHAQLSKFITFNIIQPYSRGDAEGMYPTIDIRP